VGGDGLAGLRPGSREDFDRLYLETHPRLVRTLTAVVGDRAAAEDCVQEAFVRAWRAWPRWRPEAAVEAWLYRIALNVAFSHRRRVRLRQMAERLLRPGLGRPDARVAASPLREALAKLPPREAAAVMLRHYHGYSRLETARILGLTERAVSLRVARAQAILLRELGEDWAEGLQLHPLVGSRVIRSEDNSG
jgi:RNA polymerase sigma-70 factor (ECF subfamily)